MDENTSQRGGCGGSGSCDALELGAHAGPTPRTPTVHRVRYSKAEGSDGRDCLFARDAFGNFLDRFVAKVADCDLYEEGISGAS